MFSAPDSPAPLADCWMNDTEIILGPWFNNDIQIENKSEICRSYQYVLQISDFGQNCSMPLSWRVISLECHVMNNGSCQDRCQGSIVQRWIAMIVILAAEVFLCYFYISHHTAGMKYPMNIRLSHISYVYHQRLQFYCFEK